jgi:hypothetical protein
MSNDTRKSAPVDLVFSGELLIDKPVDEVWPHVVHYSTWQNYPICEHVSGPVGEEGEVVLLAKEEGGIRTPPYYTRTIKLEPGKRIIWKCWPEQVTPDNDFLGASDFSAVVQFSVEAQGERTLFSYDNIYEFEVLYRDEAELAAFREASVPAYEEGFALIFGHLKELAETGRLASVEGV